MYNKADIANVPYPVISGDNIWISAKQGIGLEELLQMVRQHIFSAYVTCNMLIPYEQGNIVSYLNEHASVYETAYEENGTLLTIEVKEADYAKFQQYVIK